MSHASLEVQTPSCGSVHARWHVPRPSAGVTPSLCHLVCRWPQDPPGVSLSLPGVCHLVPRTELAACARETACLSHLQGALARTVPPLSLRPGLVAGA